MKVAGIIGHFGYGFEYYDGQTVKTKELTRELESYFADKNILKYDTHGKISSAIMAPLFSFISMYKAQNTIILPANNGLRVYAPLLALLHMVFKNRRIHYVVVGGWLPQFLKQHNRMTRYLKEFDGIYVETSAMKEALNQLGLKNVLVMPNFKQLTILMQNELVYNTDFPLKLCTFSRVMKEKGIEEAVNAVVEINEEMGKDVFSLDIYGQIDPDQTDWFEHLKESLPNSIHYSGIVPFERSVEVIKDYFALLFPTFYEGEGFAGTLIDAMSAGVPVIASDWKYNSEIVIEGKTGYLFKTHAIDELKRILLMAANNPDDFNNLKRECIDRAVNYQPKEVIKVLIAEMV